jgi:hypothetical protein
VLLDANADKLDSARIRIVISFFMIPSLKRL